MRHPIAMTEGTLKRYGIARVLSKQGLASRTQAATWVREGRVRVNGRVVLDPEFPVMQGRDSFTIEGLPETTVATIYLMLNKPRGLVTTVSDEKGRDTVYRCLYGTGLAWLAPVGRLDKASEGLLLFSNDPAWAARITAPESSMDKTYHVQINGTVSQEDLNTMQKGITMDGVQHAMKKVSVLREGEKNSWLEIVLNEGKNRQIRKILAELHFPVLRLVRVRIGELILGELAKGQWRYLTDDEVKRFN